MGALAGVPLSSSFSGYSYRVVQRSRGFIPWDINDSLKSMKDIIQIFEEVLSSMTSKQHNVYTPVIRQFFTQVFLEMDVGLFNELIKCSLPPDPKEQRNSEPPRDYGYVCCHLPPIERALTNNF